VDDVQPVREHIDEYEGEDAHREHRQRHPHSTPEQVQASRGETQEDGEAGESAETYGFRKRQVGGFG
jgi:hypothetical protein